MEIIEISISEFEHDYYPEYIKLFPEEERRQWHKIKETYNAGIEKFYKVLVDNNSVGFVMLETLEKNTPYYIDYFGIISKYQNKGYGTECLKQLTTKLKNIVIEIEKEDENDLQTIKRSKFYKSLGFRKINSEYLLYDVYCVPYIYSEDRIFTKNEIDKILFEYYKINNKEEYKKRCFIIK